MRGIHRHAGAVLIVVFAAACGASGPRRLAAPLGSSRADAARALKHSHYCRPDGPKRAVENYPRCDSPGFQLGESWVVARFDTSHRLERLTRFERQPSVDRARARWEELVELNRRDLGAPSDDARATLRQLDEPPAGAVSWVAWYSQEATAIIALYLVRAEDDTSPNVIEEVRWAVTSE